MKIAIVIVHNKSNAQNKEQIDFVKNLVEEVFIPVFDDNGLPIVEPNTGEQKQALVGYKLKALEVDHLIRFFQVIPFGVTPPDNLYSIDSYNVFYGVGDEDKVGNHARFFNWGVKRATDLGADTVIYLESPEQLTKQLLSNKLTELESKHFVESGFGKIATNNLFKEYGQLKEDKSLVSAFEDLKQKIDTKGGKNG